ncbi:MAG: hypothetical protein IB616_02650 [Methanosarcinales archaeon]|nr:MAG: hypothetical protein IB616_02650 [Methanosarcinales archaeon]
MRQIQMCGVIDVSSAKNELNLLKWEQKAISGLIGRAHTPFADIPLHNIFTSRRSWHSKLYKYRGEMPCSKRLWVRSGDLASREIEEWMINRNRQINQNAFKQLRDEIFKTLFGKYVVMARGKILAVGDSLEEVKDVAIDANHRFVFKVEKPKETKRFLRWPMRRK